MVQLLQEILKVFEKNNLFDEGVELVGSWCFYLYQQYLGVERFPLKTIDVDFLIPNPFRGKDELKDQSHRGQIFFTGAFRCSFIIHHS